MPKLLFRKPRYVKFGKYARVSIRGKIHHLGKYNSAESKEKYKRLIAEHWNVPDLGPPDPSERITITELAVRYIQHAEQHYRKNGKPTTEVYAAKSAIRRLRALYGSTLASEFGPLKFQAFRDSLIAENLSRATCNHYAFHVCRMFKHAAKFEFVPFGWYQRLTTIGTLQEGRSAARETDDVLPVGDAIVEKTISELASDVLKAMVRIHRLTGMRSSELCQMRPCDIDRTGEAWLYRPTVHKNQHRKTQASKQRVIVLGQQAQAILTPYLLRDHQAFCFVPESRGKAKYTACSYRRAIQRAAKRAKVPHWFPNQPRHSWATGVYFLKWVSTTRTYWFVS